MSDMVIEVISLVLSCVALIIAVFGAGLAVHSKIEVEAQKRSTHNVQLVPVDDLKGFRVDDDKTREKISNEAPDLASDALDLGDDAL